ncbi:MAG TPA: zinc ribbon domain-containing protein [Planctomycetota bacterium]|nr:zinc ribbon domain-containing protein [Planctomycetota bacterium]
MPTYDYICQACQHRLEIFQPMSESPKRKCPKCGKSKLQRQIGMGAAILFKGSGFYQTDYRSSSYTEGAKKESSPSESKPADTVKPADASKPAAESKPAETKPAASSEKSSKSARKKAR